MTEPRSVKVKDGRQVALRMLQLAFLRHDFELGEDDVVAFKIKAHAVSRNIDDASDSLKPTVLFDLVFGGDTVSWFSEGPIGMHAAGSFDRYDELCEEAIDSLRREGKY